MQLAPGETLLYEGRLFRAAPWAATGLHSACGVALGTAAGLLVAPGPDALNNALAFLMTALLAAGFGAWAGRRAWLCVTDRRLFFRPRGADQERKATEVLRTDITGIESDLEWGFARLTIHLVGGRKFEIKFRGNLAAYAKVACLLDPTLGAPWRETTIRAWRHATQGSLLFACAGLAFVLFPFRSILDGFDAVHHQLFFLLSLPLWVVPSFLTGIAVGYPLALIALRPVIGRAGFAQVMSLATDWPGRLWEKHQLLPLTWIAGLGRALVGPGAPPAGNPH